MPLGGKGTISVEIASEQIARNRKVAFMGALIPLIQLTVV